jgi:hypothetical protein
MKKIVSLVVVFFFVSTQAFARSGSPVLNDGFMTLVEEISSGSMSSEEIVARSRAMVQEARNSGVSQEQFVSALSEKMALSLTPAEIASSLEDVKANHSEARIQELARTLEAQAGQQQFWPVLITFVVLSILWVAIFYMLVGSC